MMIEEQNIDLFESVNARDLTIDQLVETFVPTRTFRRLLSAKNHIVLGTRGSGKTSVAKMISHTHLSLFDDEIAKDAIGKKKYIGIYVPMSTEWLGGLNNKKWSDELDQDLLFEWKLNVFCCISFIDAVKSCCDVYIVDVFDRVKIELSIVQKLIRYWAPNETSISNFIQLKEHLRYIEYVMQMNVTRERSLGKKIYDCIGAEFETRLFKPLQVGIDIVSDELSFPSYTAWLLCLDEAEVLTIEQQKIINSYLRSTTRKLFFKIITMPYSHNTRDTNIGAHLNLGDDYDYLYIDYESPFFYGEQADEMPSPVLELFNKRVRASGEKYKGITIEKLLGSSVLLDKKEWNFDNYSDDMLFFYKNALEEIIYKGDELIRMGRKQDFNDQIARKLKGLLVLKNAVAEVNAAEGSKKLKVYSGARMLVRCSDANPRKLIRLFSVMLDKIPDPVDRRKRRFPILSPTVQSEVILAFSESYLKRLQTEERVGPELYELISDIGEYMKLSIHGERIGIEQVSSIIIPANISDKLWELIIKAVDLGILYPDVRWDDSMMMPIKSGVFTMAYVMAPFFRLLPRRGDSISLLTMLEGKKKYMYGYFSNDDIVNIQGELFPS